jgi:hypothetical protein
MTDLQIIEAYKRNLSRELKDKRTWQDLAECQVEAVIKTVREAIRCEQQFS